jgi:hypothetical protein
VHTKSKITTPIKKPKTSMKRPNNSTEESSPKTQPTLVKLILDEIKTIQVSELPSIDLSIVSVLEKYESMSLKEILFMNDNDFNGSDRQKLAYFVATNTIHNDEFCSSLKKDGEHDLTAITKTLETRLEQFFVSLESNRIEEIALSHDTRFIWWVVVCYYQLVPFAQFIPETNKDDLWKKIQIVVGRMLSVSMYDILPEKIRCMIWATAINLFRDPGGKNIELHIYMTASSVFLKHIDRMMTTDTIAMLGIFIMDTIKSHLGPHLFIEWKKEFEDKWIIESAKFFGNLQPSDLRLSIFTDFVWCTWHTLNHSLVPVLIDSLGIHFEELVGQLQKAIAEDVFGSLNQFVFKLVYFVYCSIDNNTNNARIAEQLWLQVTNKTQRFGCSNDVYLFMSLMKRRIDEVEDVARSPVIIPDYQ